LRLSWSGCWTFCPDPASFQSYTTVNIYNDTNAYYMSTDKWKRTPRPAIRDFASNGIYPGYGMPLGSVKRAVAFFGWVFFLISSGSPRVLRSHMGHTCGEPNETELTAAHGSVHRSF